MTGTEERITAMLRRVLTIFRERFGVGVSPTPAEANASAAASTAGANGASTTSTTGTSTTTGDFSGFAAPVTALAGTLARVEQHAQQQVTSKAQASADTRQLAPRRAELFGHLRSIAGVAKTLKSQVPGIGILKAPASKTRADTLVTEAESFAKNAGIYAQVLIEHGQPNDFVAQLTAATAAYKDAIALRGSSLATQRGSTAGLKSDLATGQTLVRQMDANLQRVLRNSPADLAAWKSAKRITQSVGGAAASAAPAVPLAPTTPVATPLTGTQTSSAGNGTSSVNTQTAPATHNVAQAASVT